VVDFANLAPRKYRFIVRAVSLSGVVSAEPAVITFTVLPPFYLRWWFVSLAALAVGMLVYAIYRYRVTRLLEVANMRTRIATDLHDDIGANLTRINILSEVAKQQIGTVTTNHTIRLLRLLRSARESVASMSDIVWAINPERDHLRESHSQDATARRRDFHSEGHRP
jgi:signal transduction histidine kinase